MRIYLEYIILILGMSLALLSFSSIDLFGQTKEVFEIHQIICNEEKKDIKIYVKAIDNEGRSLLRTADASRFEVFEKIGNQPIQELDIEGLRIKTTTEDFAKDGEDVFFDPIHVLFLLDLSGSMNLKNLELAKEAILKVLNSNLLSENAVKFAWFDEDVSKSINLSLENFETIMKPMRATGKNTNLHKALKVKIKELAKQKGRRALILLTDGEHDSNTVPNIRAEEIIGDIANLDSSFYIFPIGIGKNTNELFLRTLANTSRSPYDKYEFEVAPKEISDVFEKILLGLRSNVVLSVKPHSDYCSYGNEERTFAVRYAESADNPKVASKEVVLGGTAETCNLCRGNTTSWAMVFIIGLFFLIGIYLLTFPVLYLWKQRAFKRNYVRYYGEVRKSKVSKRDPMTMEYLKDNDKVVVVGEDMMLLSTWEYHSDKKDQITKDHQHFFDIEVLNKKSLQQRIKWLIFGAAGGFIAWLIHAFLGELDINWYQQMLKSMDTTQKQISLSVYAQTLIGISMGISICAALATVEELGQSRKLSIGRIIGRSLLGGFIAAIIFFIESIFIAKFLPIKYLGGLVGWTLFGTALGWIVSIGSSIEGKKGLLGGLISGIVAFHFYFLLNLLGSEVARVISFIIYGSILGFILYFIIRYLEDFEIVYLSPKRFEGDRNPISKWLKSNQIDYIYIGTDQTCEVFVKWKDQSVAPKHAKLSYENGQVFIEPQADTFVNNKAIKQKTALQDKDIIQVGTSGESKMQFLEKEKKQESDYTDSKKHPKKGGQKGGNYQTPPSKRRITVKRRNRR